MRDYRSRQKDELSEEQLAYKRAQDKARVRAYKLRKKLTKQTAAYWQNIIHVYSNAVFFPKNVM